MKTEQPPTLTCKREQKALGPKALVPSKKSRDERVQICRNHYFDLRSSEIACLFVVWVQEIQDYKADWLLRHWAWLRRGYRRHRSLIDWLIFSQEFNNEKLNHYCHPGSIRYGLCFSSGHPSKHHWNHLRWMRSFWVRPTSEWGLLCRYLSIVLDWYSRDQDVLWYDKEDLLATKYFN